MIPSILAKSCPSFEQIWIPWIQECFVLCLIKIHRVVEEKILKDANVLSQYIAFIFPYKRVRVLIWKKKLNPLYPTEDASNQLDLDTEKDFITIFQLFVLGKEFDHVFEETWML